MAPLLAWVLLLLSTASSIASSHVCDPTTHGASVDAPDNAESIQAALDECSGGGAVTVNGGAFRSGPLVVRGRGVTFSLSAGASLVMAFPPAKWPTSGDAYVDVLTFQGLNLIGY